MQTRDRSERTGRVRPCRQRSESAVASSISTARYATPRSCAASRPPAIVQKPLRQRRASAPFKGCKRKAPYCCAAAINPADWGRPSRFVVGKLTSVDRRATLSTRAIEFAKLAKPGAADRVLGLTITTGGNYAKRFQAVGNGRPNLCADPSWRRGGECGCRAADRRSEKPRDASWRHV